MSERIDKLIGKKELSHHTFNLISNPKQEIKLKPMLMKHFKILLKASEGIVRNEMLADDPIEVMKIDSSFDEVLQDCVVYPEKFNPLELYIGDWFYLFTMLRAVSKGNIIDFNVRCSNQIGIVDDQPQYCEHEIHKSVNLNELQKIESKDFSNIFVDLGGDLKVYVSPPRRIDEYALNEYIKKEEIKLGSTEASMAKVAMWIHCVTEGTSKIEDLDVKEKIKMFDSFSFQQKEKLIEYSDDLSFGLPVFIELKCEKCSHVSEERLVYLSDFFTL